MAYLGRPLVNFIGKRRIAVKVYRSRKHQREKRRKTIHRDVAAIHSLLASKNVLSQGEAGRR